MHARRIEIRRIINENYNAPNDALWRTVRARGALKMKEKKPGRTIIAGRYRKCEMRINQMPYMWLIGTGRIKKAAFVAFFMLKCESTKSTR